MRKYNIPFSKTAVLQNAIDPIDIDITEKFNTKKVNLIYHTTPHRGLAILVPVFERLAEEFGDKIHLDVFSSFKIYGWDERDRQFDELFDKIKNHPNMTYHAFKPNTEVREALSKAHIFAYPSIWLETSCIALMEAMSAGCICVHPDYGALPETAANWTTMYSMHENVNNHASIIYNILKVNILSIIEDDSNRDSMLSQLTGQKAYADLYYSWELRKRQWEGLLQYTLAQPLVLEIPKGEIFRYES